MSSVFFTLTAIALTAAFPPRPNLPGHLDLAAIRALPVQHDGRWMPLDTLARDTVETVTSGKVLADRDPVLLLLAWTFDAETWKDVPLIPLPNAELRKELRLPPDKIVYSFDKLANHEYLNQLMDHVSHLQGERRLNPLESKAGEIGKKLELLSQVFQGQVIRIIPDARDALGAWRPIRVVPEETKGLTNSPAVDEWIAVGIAFLRDDGPGFSAAVQRLTSVLSALPAAYKPDPRLIRVELRYNRFDFFRLAWIVMIAAASLSAAGMIVRRKWFDVLAAAGLVAGFGILTYGLSLRWQIAGHIPAANMFESLLFLSWGLGLFAILAAAVRSPRLVSLTAAAMGGVALVLADCLPLDHYIRPIAPVLLDTIWMSVHVPVIMVAYSVLTLAVLIAHFQLLVSAAVPARAALIRKIDSLHYGYAYTGSLLLLAGIVTGSMWAASSWGRYWGWDPKEVWSLVALLGYLAILHVRTDRSRPGPGALVVAAVLVVALFSIVVPRLAPVTGVTLLALTGTVAAMLIFLLARGPFADAIKSILAFWLIIMTYVGVNFVLGTGLHSYAFGTGAVVHYLFLIGGIDLALIAACSGVYLLRFSGE